MTTECEETVIFDYFDRYLERVPVLYPFYFRHAATYKRNYCLTMHKLGLLKPWSFVQWLVTNKCNFTCPFCESSSGKPMTDELDTREARLLLDDMADMGVKRVIFSGGEPFMRDDILELIDYSVAKGIKPGLVTNSYYIPELWDELKKHRYFLLFTSLDGPPGVHEKIRGRQHAYDRVMTALELFHSINTPSRLINTAVHPDNFEWLPQLAESVIKSHATEWRLSPITSVGRAADQPDYALSGDQQKSLLEFMVKIRKTFPTDLGESHTYLKLLGGYTFGKPFFCGAGLTRCAIMANGDVLACQQVYDPAYSEGNVRERPFSEIWKHEFKSLRGQRSYDSCKGCEHLSACRSGCWADMENHGVCQKPAWENL
ncbi:radical SAM protein [candidate division KSB1 bacterium]|nr:radical SAM protein [candidate division KSB1 bacterium]